MAGNANVAGRSVASKVAAILRCFDANTHETLSEIARRTGLPLSTTYRLVTELVTAGVMFRTENGLYTLLDRSAGPTVLVGCPYSALRDAAVPVIDDLFVVSRRTTRLATVRSGRLAYIERSAGQAAVTAFGDDPPLPMHATALGKTVLAFAPPQLLDHVTAAGLSACTPHTTTNVNRLRAGLINVRRAGMAVSWGEFDGRTSGIAVAVFGAAGQLVGAIGLEINGQADLTRLEPTLRIAGRVLTRRLAAAGPGAFAATDATHVCTRCAGPGSGGRYAGRRWSDAVVGRTGAGRADANRSLVTAPIAPVGLTATLTAGADRS